MPLRLWCNYCTPSEVYRVEPNVEEDDPTHRVPPPGRYLQSKSAKEQS
jgi:hypothetical protein